MDLRKIFTRTMTGALILVIVFGVYSCRPKPGVASRLDLSRTPLQTVDSMYILQTENGEVQMRVFAPVMERYETDSLSFDLFPKGINVYAYTDGGVLESTIVADEARHDKTKAVAGEIWKAYGNVVVRNVVKQQTMETDTIYWDREKHEIFTECYVRMYSPDGFVQGYGMRSDERARNAIMKKPFNNYFVVVQDSTEVTIDSVNFIGPLIKK